MLKCIMHHLLSCSDSCMYWCLPYIYGDMFDLRDRDVTRWHRDACWTSCSGFTPSYLTSCSAFYLWFLLFSCWSICKYHDPAEWSFSEHHFIHKEDPSEPGSFGASNKTTWLCILIHRYLQWCNDCNFSRHDSPIPILDAYDQFLSLTSPPFDPWTAP